MFSREIKLHKKIQARLEEETNILRLKETFEEGGESLMVLEIMDGHVGKLSFTPELALDLSRQVLGAVSKLHRTGFVHFDIRPGTND